MFGNKRKKAQKDRSSIGHVLVDLEYCAPQDIIDVLEEQIGQMPRLGQMLLDRGMVTKEQLEHALLRQRVLRGESDPAELARYGAEKRREALSEMTDKLRAIAKTADVLAGKLQG